jgi:hypothetical protein
MTAVREVKPGMTFNPDTGSYAVRDADGGFIGDTTQRDVADRWWLHGTGSKLQGRPTTLPRSLTVGESTGDSQ